MPRKKRASMKDKFIAFLEEIGVDGAEQFVSCGIKEIRENGQKMRSIITGYITAANELEEELERRDEEAKPEPEPAVKETEVEVVE